MGRAAVGGGRAPSLRRCRRAGWAHDAKRSAMNDLERAREALRHLDAGCPRPEWAVIGMAAKDAGLDVDDFISWSRGAANFDSERDCRTAWRSFKRGSVTAATLFAKAIEAGW